LRPTNSEEVEFRVASELFGQARTLTGGDLRTLKLVTKIQNRLVPTVGGRLLFGTTRSRHFPDAWIQCGRFFGTDRSKITDSAEYRDYPIPSIDRALNFVKKIQY
jgi:ATP-dependent DNA helicase RecG